MPFTLPSFRRQPRPHPPIERAAPSDNMFMLVNEKKTILEGSEAHMLNLWVPGPHREDIPDVAMDLTDSANPGITCSHTDFDLCSRLQSGLTALNSTQEEGFFAVPTSYPFNTERRLESLRNDRMVTDKELWGNVFPASEALDGDDTLLPIDTDPLIQLRLRQTNILDERISGPGCVWRALRE